MNLTRWLISGAYTHILNVHFLCLGLSLGWLLLSAFRRTSEPSRTSETSEVHWRQSPGSDAGCSRATAAGRHSSWGLALAALLLLALLATNALMVFQRSPHPSVYSDEFFYVSTACNIAASGRCELMVWQGFPPALKAVGAIIPPYPQGWSYVLSWAMPRVGAPSPGVCIAAPWSQAVGVVQLLHCLMPAFLYMALRRRFSSWVALAGTAAFTAIPVVEKLSSCASPESGALFALILTFWAYEEVRHAPSWWRLVCLALCASACAEMRPECLLPGGVLLVHGCWLAYKSSISRLGVAAAVFIFVVFVSPAAWVMVVHNAELNHHFVALPRAGLSMWENRLENVLNNIAFFFVNAKWPASLSLLALLGVAGAALGHREASVAGAALGHREASAAGTALGRLCTGDFFSPFVDVAREHVSTTNELVPANAQACADTRRDCGWASQVRGNFESRVSEFRFLALACSLWIVVMGAFLSWYPFGDFSCVHSLDTWRFAFHAVVPALVLACIGLTWCCSFARCDDSGQGWNVACPVVAWALLACSLQFWVVTPDLMSAPHVLERTFVFAARSRQYLPGRVLVVQEPEYYVMARFGLGLPCVLALGRDVRRQGLEGLGGEPDERGALERREYVLYDVESDLGKPQTHEFAGFTLQCLELSEEDYPFMGLYLMLPSETPAAGSARREDSANS